MSTRRPAVRCPADQQTPLPAFVPFFAANAGLEMALYTSQSKTSCSFAEADLLWRQPLTYSTGAATSATSLTLPVGRHLLRNGSTFAHVTIYHAGQSPNPKHKLYDRATSSSAVQLNKFGAVRKPVGLRNLLTQEPAPWEVPLLEAQAEEAADGGIARDYISYMRPSLRVHLVVDHEPRGNYAAAAGGGARAF